LSSLTHSLPENLHLSPEFRLVAACSWVPQSGQSLRQNQIIASLPLGQLNWDETASLVLRHGVVGQFCTVMGSRGWLNVPLTTIDQLKRIRTQQVVRALGQVAELARVGRLFAEAGIPLIPLKGVALSQELYSDPCIRSSVDLDIMVRPEDVDNAEKLLQQAGYRHAFGLRDMGERQKCHIIRTFHHHIYINDASGVHLELHWKSFLWTKEQTAALWETGIQSTWLDSGLIRLSPEDNILYLADHGSRHGWSCLKWLSDVAMLTAGLSADEWLSLYKRAAVFDLQRVVGQTATLLEWFYGNKSPQYLREVCVSDAVVQKLSAYAASQLLASAEEIALQASRFAGPRLACRIKQLKPSTPLFELISGVIIGQEDFLDLPLANNLFWLYLPLRPFLWLKRHYLPNARHRRTDG